MPRSWLGKKFGLVLLLGSGLLAAGCTAGSPTVAGGGTNGCALTSSPATVPGSIRVDGRTRDFILSIPKGYAPQRPHALVFAFHGRTNSNAQARGYYGIEKTINDALFVYPSGVRESGRRYNWHDPGDAATALRDYRLFDELLALLGRHYCIDPDRIYLVGHSLGASFANDLACARPERVRAVASLGGGMSMRACRRPVAAMVIHNPDDRLVPVRMGQHLARLLPDCRPEIVPDAGHYWVFDNVERLIEVAREGTAAP